MSINTAIYNTLAGDATLQGLLASSHINPTQPAIYELWATEHAAMPYMNLTFNTSEANHWAKRETRLEIAIFSDQDSTNAEAIRNRVVKVLDRQKIDLENGYKARAHYDTDGMITEPTPNVTHWQVSFTVFYFRSAETYAD